MGLILGGESSSSAILPPVGSYHLCVTSAGVAYLLNSSGGVIPLGVNPSYANIPSITGSGTTYTYSGILTGGVYLGLQLTGASAKTITIPASTGSYYAITIADIQNNAGTYNVTITSTSSIIGGSLLYTNGQSITYIDTSAGWVAQ